MILADTSVWIDHLRRGNRRLANLLEEDRVIGHPFVLGEIACGNLRNRREILAHLARLPQAVFAEHDECLGLLDSAGLFGRGLGWVDLHLLASARLTGCSIWTTDRALQRAARLLGLLV